MFDVLEHMERKELTNYIHMLTRNNDDLKGIIRIQNEIIDNQRNVILTMSDLKRKEGYLFGEAMDLREFDKEMHRKYAPTVKEDEGNRPVCADSPCECRSTSK